MSPGIVLPAAQRAPSSHGCVRLTKWDEEQFAGAGAPGITVEFV